MNSQKPTVEKKSVLVTGAAKGIGRATCEALSELGWRVFAGVRNESDSVPGCESVVLDVTSDEQVAQAVLHLESELEQGLSGLVNNAGYVQPGPLEVVTTEALHDLLAVNVEGVHRVTRAFLPLLRVGNGIERGNIVNISSMSGVFAIPTLGAYNTSKFALEGMSDAWRRELALQGIGVALIEPGPVKTPIWQRSQSLAQSVVDSMTPIQHELYGETIAAVGKSSEQAEQGALPPKAVVDKVVKALQSNRPPIRQVVGFKTWVFVQVSHWLPQCMVDFLVLRGMGASKNTKPFARGVEAPNRD